MKTKRYLEELKILIDDMTAHKNSCVEMLQTYKKDPMQPFVVTGKALAGLYQESLSCINNILAGWNKEYEYYTGHGANGKKSRALSRLLSSASSR